MFSRKSLCAVIAAAFLAAVGVHAASASSVTVIGSGTNPDNNSATFSAEAIFNQSGTTLSITLENTTAAVDMNSAKELLVGIEFSPENASITGGSVVGSFANSLSFSGTTGTIGGPGSTPTSAQGHNWTITSGPSSTLLWGGSAKNIPDPSAIIGGTSDTTVGDTVSYTNANSSVTGESPEIYESVTFNLTVPATFDPTQLDSFTFLFNTDGTTHLTGTPTGGQNRTLPLPSSVWGGIGLIGALGLLKFSRRHKAA